MARIHGSRIVRDTRLYRYCNTDRTRDCRWRHRRHHQQHGQIQATHCRNSYHRNGNLDIYGRNVSSKTNYAVCKFKAQQDNPSITRFVTAAGKVQYLAVWVDKRRPLGGTNTDIYCRNIRLGSKPFLVSSGDAAKACVKYFPEIVDKWVVWLEAGPAGAYAVRARDLRDSTIYRVATCRVLSPLGLTRRTVGAKTAYTVVYTSGKGNISGRNLPAGTPFGVSQSSKF